MSRSYKKPIIKDKPRNKKRTSLYHRPIRRSIKSNLRGHFNLIRDELDSFELGEPEIKHPKNIINDYDYCDYIFIRFLPEDETKYSRK